MTLQSVSNRGNIESPFERGEGSGRGDGLERERRREREAAPGCGEVHAKVGADLTLQFYWVR
jgi:hypothetical protein